MKMKYFKSIRTQLLLAITITLFVFLLVAMGGVYLFQKDALTRESIKKVTELDSVLKAGFKSQMLTHDTALTQTMVNEVGAFKNITDIFIINTEGVVKFSPDPNHIGIILHKDSIECRQCHHDATGRKNLTLQIRNSHGVSVLRNVTHIYNEEACFSCHPANRKILGLLFVDYSTADTDALISVTLWRLFLTAVAAFMIISIVILFITNRLIHKPIALLIDGTNDIKNGNYKKKIDYIGNIEFTILADSFNDMSEKLRIGRDQLEERIQERTIELKTSNEQLACEIVEHSKAEEALRQSEERYALTIAAVNDGIWDWHVPSGNAFFSPLYYGILGYKDREFPAAYDSWHLLVHPEDIESVEGALQKSIESGKGFAIDLRMRQKTGEWLWVSTRGKTVENDAENKALRIIGTLTDITERKLVEAEKTALESQNRQLQKSESLGRMAASIAHHFNNQLGAVIGYLEMVIDEMPKGAAHINSLNKAMQSAWTAADMSGLMLTYLGQTHKKVEPLDLSYSCNKILPLIKATLPENVVIETDFPLPRPIIMANAGEIQQILTNLITNAWESIGKNKGTISLNVKTASPAEIPTKNRFPIDWQQQDKAYACLEVIDTGSGIKSKEIETLFDPFFSTKFTGRGMGLAVVMGLANSYKGVITVESKPGKGSTFRIFFPVSEEALRQSQTAETNDDSLISKASPGKMEEGGTVLLVEDEEQLRKMVVIMLGRLGFSVLEAKDGIEALEVFGKHQSEIKFVLTDLTMPRMNGWETLKALRKLKPNIPIILASGYDLAHVMEGDHPELPQAFLAKPYNLKALRAAISQTLGSRNSISNG